MRELYEADFHKPRIYGSGRVLANVWDVFTRMRSRDGRGRRAAVDFVVCFGLGEFVFHFRFFFFFERTRPAASMMPPCLIYRPNSIRHSHEHTTGWPPASLVEAYTVGQQDNMAICQNCHMSTSGKATPLAHFVALYTDCLLYTSPSPRD